MTRSEFVHRGGLWVLAQLPLMLIALVLPVWLGAGTAFPQNPLSILGVFLTAFGTWLTIWGSKSLGEALSPYPGPISDAALRREGPYRLMRHPIYTGVMLASLGWALWWLSGFGLVYLLVLAFFFDRKAAFEEKRLQEKYPDYPAYARQVKKFIPGVY